MSNVYLTVCHTNNHLGASFYDDQMQELHILNDVEDTDFVSLSNLIKEIRPTYVIASKAQDAVFLRKLRMLCNFNVPNDTLNDDTTIDDDGNDISQFDFGEGEKEITCVPETSLQLHSSNFEQMNATETTADVPVVRGQVYGNSANFSKGSKVGSLGRKEDIEEDEAEDSVKDEFYAALTLMPFITFDEIDAKTRIEALFTEHGKNSNLMAHFRFDYSSRNMVRAFGALLRFLDQQRIGVEFDDLNVKTPIKSIVTFVIDDIVELDHATLKALQVFESEYNPANMKKQQFVGRQFKDGISLFSLCNVCRSTSGKQLLKRWFEHPTMDRGVLTNRQDAISYFYQDCHLDVARFLRSKMPSVSNVKPIFRRFKSGSANVSDFINVYETLLHTIEILRFIQEREIKLAVTKGRMKLIDDLLRTAGVLKEIMDFDESVSETRFVVNSGLNADLDEMKARYAELPAKLTAIAEREAGKYGVESCSVAYVPIIGYLLAISEDARLGSKALAELKMVYNAENDNYYKSPCMDHLDGTIGDIKIQIIDEEKTIMMKLQKLVLARSSVIIQAVDLAATLDCLTSLAIVARELNWHRPQLVDHPIIDVGNARHPLSELTCQFTFVPNSIQSGMDFSKVKLISGPNASGKSVYLKAVGIIAYLTHIGSFVPADYAMIGPINRIVTRMYTIDSVMDGMSSFANDLKQMSGAIRRADEFSLVIMDEFGKGTMTEVGLSLLASSLNYWIEKGKEHCPHIYAASHFHSLKTLLNPCNFLSYHTLDVNRNGDELEFQYKLIDGMTDNSFASYTALKHGIPRDIVKRANEVYDHLKEGHCLVDVPPLYVEEIDEDMWLVERMEQLLDAFMEWDLEVDLPGFLQLVKIALQDEEDADDASILNEPVAKRFRLMEDGETQTTAEVGVTGASTSGQEESKETTSDVASVALDIDAILSTMDDIASRRNESVLADKSVDKSNDRSNLNVTFLDFVEEIYFKGTVAENT